MCIFTTYCRHTHPCGARIHARDLTLQAASIKPNLRSLPSSCHLNHSQVHTSSQFPNPIGTFLNPGNITDILHPPPGSDLENAHLQKSQALQLELDGSTNVPPSSSSRGHIPSEFMIQTALPLAPKSPDPLPRSQS